MQRNAEVEHFTEHGCSVLCLGCPEGMLFGIDYSAWTVGPNFMGVKLIPPGLHYIYSSGSGEDIGVSRTGFFLHMKPRDVAVYRWDPATEELVRPDNEDEELRYADGVRHFDFDAHLGPYPLDLSAQWSELTRYATAGLVGRIEPVAKVIRSKRAEYDASADKERGAEEAEASARAEDAMSDDPMTVDGSSMVQPDDSISGKPPPTSQPSAEGRLESNNGAGTLFFSTLPRGRKNVGKTPQETTLLHMDRTSQLEQMIAQEYGKDEMGILGELQIAYIAFLLGQNFDAYEQWRALLLLLCSCEAAVAKWTELYVEFCRVFYAQLSQAPSDLFGDDLTKDNFLGSCALSLLELCDTSSAHPRLRKRCGKLRELVQQKFGISVDDLALLGEDAPQIVDLDGRDLIDLGGGDLTRLD